MKCQKCNQEMKQSGPYAPRKDEGQPAYRGSLPVYYSCTNKDCSEFYKSVGIKE